jgi:hypothetical protein
MQKARHRDGGPFEYGGGRYYFIGFFGAGAALAGSAFAGAAAWWPWLKIFVRISTGQAAISCRILPPAHEHQAGGKGDGAERVADRHGQCLQGWVASAEKRIIRQTICAAKSAFE